MLKILKTSLQWYVNQELSDVQTGFRNGKGNRDQIANIHLIIKKAREFQKKTSISALFTISKPLTMWITTNWKILKEIGIPNHLTCLLRNLYAGQEATVRTRHGTTDWFQIRKGVRRLYIVTLCIELICRARHATCQDGTKHKLETKLLGEISTTLEMQMIPPL